MMEPVLSVIVPVYNTAPWLRNCLDSICSQSYRHLEIICVNDGSTDNSAEILAEYAAADSRIKVFTQENAGLSAARNTGLDNATGEWVTGVDSDDYLYPGIYEKAIGYVNAAVDMVFFGVQKVSEDGEPLSHCHYFDLPAAGEYPVSAVDTAGLNVCFWSKLWRRSLIEDNLLRFPVGLVHEDEALYTLAMPHVRKFAFCPAIGYAYMQRENSIMHEYGLDALKRIRRFALMTEFVYAEYEKRRLLHTPARKYLQRLFINICRSLYSMGQGAQKEVALKEILSLVHRCNMLEDDYSIERILPCSRKGVMTINRYRRVKIYRFLGIPIWLKCYTYQGRPVTPAVVWFHLRIRFCRIWGGK